MTHWKLILAYDGTPFHGWQVQPGLSTVQGLLSDAIHRTIGERVLPQGSGRTDTGVHALGQVASFSLSAPIPSANLHNALNRCLPPSIRILSVEIVPSNFHARHSAREKTYEYRIFPLKPAPLKSFPIDPHELVPHSSQSHRDEWVPSANLDPAPQSHEAICPPILAPYVWPCPWPLDLAALNQAASQVLGTHDFTSFAAADPDLTTRTNLSRQTSPVSSEPSFAPPDASGYSGPSASPAHASRHPTIC
jgi:tRNA pseudouridine38-40 synthase